MSTFTPQDIRQAQLMLRDCQHEDEIVAALDILGNLDAVSAVPYMMCYICDNRLGVRNALESALLKLGQPAIPAIVEHLPMLAPEHHVHLQTLVEKFWKDASTNQIHHLINHEDNRVRWAIAWTLAKPLKTLPPEDIGHVFEGLADEPLTAIRWAATQSLTTLAHSSDNIPAELIHVALPVMVDNFKYGDVNLSESSVSAIALLTSPPNRAITSMLQADSSDLQVAAIKILTMWAQDDKHLDEGTLQSLKSALPSASWQVENEVSRLRYMLSISNPEVLGILDNIPDTFNDELDPTQDVYATGNIMLPPLEQDYSRRE